MPDYTNLAGWQVQQLTNLESSAGFQAYAVASASVPATNTPTANPDSATAIAIIIGGTVSNVQVSANGTGGTFVSKATASNVAVPVPSGGAIELTWSVTPTGFYWMTSAGNVAEVDN
jgi:hypothetical protein